ncbi:thioredoxin domain-containing protein 9 [Scenedesmus sp. PABB004]|nr:thioredoxin domain-containing protein 9 [Scenedesmus sp. PABB004]
MAGLVQAAVEQSVLRVAKQLEDQLDSQLHALDNLGDDDLERIRQRRIADLRQQQEKSREWLARGHGEVGEIHEEKAFFKEMKGEERMVAHFYRDSWPCKVMDKHIGILCRQHLETKFVRINAEKAPYLTDKLKIWMLPTLALIKAEKVVDYVVGFDALGGADDFSTDVLADRLAAADVIKPDAAAAAARAAKPARNTIRSGIYSARGESDEDSDFGDE